MEDLKRAIIALMDQVEDEKVLRVILALLVEWISK